MIFGLKPPILGTQNGPVWLHSGSFDNYMTGLNPSNQSVHPFNKAFPSGNDTSNYIHRAVFDAAGTFLVSDTDNKTAPSLGGPQTNLTVSRKSVYWTARDKRASNSDYWLPTLAPLGSVSNPACHCPVLSRLHADSMTATFGRQRLQILPRCDGLWCQRRRHS